ncbi:winged helix-turn-helix transcriptional regulator [Micromonospora sp. NBC_01699]|uniref:winged helix-turn-helix transcriptional regulator n=1 Tax=Micromonospora sp. NBC_01699 TaxID=2975984 RepID=UPI002E2E4FD4|nr:winged helix-turn-helix transcriptional regulator [Micromonospora sp. NBC_01699]
MPTNRSYADACTIARALDVVGERWALLVVRELLLGPQRFSDLRRSLSGASSNLVTDRLRELAARGVIRRRQLPPPAGSQVYELTEWGRGLEPIVLALGNWGGRIPLPPEPTTLSATSVLIFLRCVATLDPEAPTTTYRLELDGPVWTLRTIAGQVRIEPGEPARPDASLRTDPRTLNALLADPNGLDASVVDGTAVVDGDLSALRRLLRSATGSGQAAAGSDQATAESDQEQADGRTEGHDHALEHGGR